MVLTAKVTDTAYVYVQGVRGEDRTTWCMNTLNTVYYRLRLSQNRRLGEITIRPSLHSIHKITNCSPPSARESGDVHLFRGLIITAISVIGPVMPRIKVAS